VPDKADRTIALGLAVLVTVVALACRSNGSSTEDDARLARSSITDLIVKDVKVGEGQEARSGRRVTVHYTGWLYHPSKEGNRGRSFDSSRTRGEPFSFTLGAGEVIQGWDQGVAGMKEGGRRILTIPGRLAYGSSGSGEVIPPDATLVFDIELLRVQ
jgi:FKBP-type peptidyl-prolyl cis-trans isomerase FkpA